MRRRARIRFGLEYCPLWASKIAPDRTSKSKKDSNGAGRMTRFSAGNTRICSAINASTAAGGRSPLRKARPKGPRSARRHARPLQDVSETRPISLPFHRRSSGYPRAENPSARNPRHTRARVTRPPETSGNLPRLRRMAFRQQENGLKMPRRRDVLASLVTRLQLRDAQRVDYPTHARLPRTMAFPFVILLAHQESITVESIGRKPYHSLQDDVLLRPRPLRSGHELWAVRDGPGR